MLLFDGNKEAEILKQEIKAAISVGRVPEKILGSTLAIVQVGDDEASQKYVCKKTRLAKDLGLHPHVFTISDKIPDDEILDQISEIFEDEDVTGGIIQLPLSQKTLYPALDLIPVTKDLDLLSSKSLTLLSQGQAYFVAPIVRSTQLFLTRANMNLTDLKVGIVGGGRLVGLPLMHFFLQQGAKVAILDSSEEVKDAIIQHPNLTHLPNYEHGQKLDFNLVVLSTSVPKLMNPADLGRGCSVIDFGTAVVDGKVIGNLDYDQDFGHLDWIAPSPGGMGPLVVRYLLMNFLGI